MKIVVTDTGLIWNPDNPALERFKGDVLCVYINGYGEKSDKYQSFSLDWHKDLQIRGQADSGSKDCLAYQYLKKAGKQLNELFANDREIIFLTDCEPSTLYPYNVIKDINRHSDLHLVTMEPWSFLGKKKARQHRNLLEDLSPLKSLFYAEADKMFPMDAHTDLKDLFSKASKDSEELLWHIFIEITMMDSGKYYYDCHSRQYIPTNSGFEEAVKAMNERIFMTGDIIDPLVCHVGQTDFDYLIAETKKGVEAFTPRIDGKQLCEKLREKRIELAEMNNIAFESEECPSEGPCAGTCPKCDEESEYLRNELKKIPAGKRKYPMITIDEGELK